MELNQAKGKIGDLLVFHTIGKGASCKVKLGYDPKSNRYIAIKIVQPDHYHLIQDEL